MNYRQFQRCRQAAGLSVRHALTAERIAARGVPVTYPWIDPEASAAPAGAGALAFDALPPG